jgi:hypothetical protein
MMIIMLAMLGFLYLFVPVSHIRDDNQIGSYPLFRDLGEQLSHGEFPIMGQYSWHGAAVAGEYGAGVFHPPILIFAYLVYLFPDQPELLGFGWVVYNYALMLTGIYCLLRSYGKSPLAAAYAGCALGSSGYLWGLSSAWYVILQSLAWLPWYHLLLRQACLAESPLERWWRTCLAGLCLTMLITTGWVFTDFMAVMIHIMVFVECYFVRHKLWVLCSSCIVGVIGLAVSAPAWLMLIECSAWSNRVVTRAAMNPWELCISWQEYINFLFPLFQLQNSQLPVGMFSMGIFPIMIILWALVTGRKYVDLFAIRYLILMVVVLILCQMPAIPPFRWNFRWLPLFNYCAALASASIIDHKANNFLWMSTKMKWLDIYIFIPLSLGVVALAAYFSNVDLLLLDGQIWGPITWWFLVCFGYFWLTSSQVQYSRKMVYLCMNCAVMSCLVAIYAFPVWGYQLKYTDNPTSKGICTNPNWYFVEYTETTFPEKMSHFHPGNTQCLSGIKTINGYSAMWPMGTSQIFNFNVQGALKDEVAWHNMPVIPQQLFLRMAVDGLILQQPLIPQNQFNQDFEYVGMIDQLHVYHRRTAPSPLTHLHQSVIFNSSFKEAKNKVDIIHMDYAVADDLPANYQHVLNTKVNYDLPREFKLTGSNTTAVAMDVDTQGNEQPSFITVARPWLPGYRATWNDREIPVYRVDLLMPGVLIPAQQSGILKLRYFPRSLERGLISVAITLALMLITGGLIYFLYPSATVIATLDKPVEHITVSPQRSS